MSDIADGQQTAPDAPVQAEAQDTTPDPVMSRLDELSSQIGKLTSTPAPEPQGGLSDTLPYQEGAQSQEQEYGFDPGYQDDGYQPGQYEQFQQQYDPQAAMAQLDQLIEQRAGQIVDQRLTPHLQRQRANELERQYPELADPQKAAEVVKATAQYAQRIGQPELARNPELVELVFLAEQARTRAAQETPADGGSGVHLEGGGAAPQQPEEDAGDGMLRAFGIDPNAVSW